MRRWKNFLISVAILFTFSLLLGNFYNCVKSCRDWFGVSVFFMPMVTMFLVTINGLFLSEIAYGSFDACCVQSWWEMSRSNPIFFT